MPTGALTLDLLAEPMSICRLAADAPVPAWAMAAPFFCVARTTEELSIMCATARVPAGTTESSGWRLLRLAGPFEFSEVGVLLRVAAPLAEADVSIMPVATWDTDYVLVREAQLGEALVALRAAGHAVRTAGA